MSNSIKHIITGLMSGTSLDGTDLALVEFTRHEQAWEYTIQDAVTIPYPPALEERLESAAGSPGRDLARLHFDLGRYYGTILNTFHSGQKIKPELIASHGHTVFHQPSEGYTLQIGSGEAISLVTGIETVADFRSKDVILGGEGAPLVPAGDALLFAKYAYCLNLGGFANISYHDGKQRLAFDIAPVNKALNYLAAKAGRPYDMQGEMAARGKVDSELLARLNNIAFYSKTGPRSLGMEWFEREFRPLLDNSSLTIPDLLATVSEHISVKIAACLDLYPEKSMLVTGGGAFNKKLLTDIKNKTKVRLVIPEEDLIRFKEAVIFAFLGLLRKKGEINCLASVTGAASDSCSGVIYKP